MRPYPLTLLAMACVATEELVKSAEFDYDKMTKNLQGFAQKALASPAYQKAKTQGGLVGAGLGGAGGAALGLGAGYLLGGKDPAKARRRRLGGMLLGLGIGGGAGALMGGDSAVTDKWFKHTGVAGISPQRASADPVALRKAVETAVKNDVAVSRLRSKLGEGNWGVQSMDLMKDMFSPVTNYIQGR